MDKAFLKSESFSFLCRICLQNSSSLIPIYSSDAAEMLKTCNFCLVSEQDGLPTNICSACLNLLIQCYSFKELCKKSEVLLREVLKERQKSVTLEINNQEHSLDSIDLRDDITRPDIHASETSAQNTETKDELFRKNTFSLKEDFISFLEEPLPPPLPYQCQKCDQSFSEEYDLNLHQSIHNSNLVCLACSKRFTGRQGLKRHLKTHLMKKPHICKICSKSFPESYDLVKHIRQHSGIPREKRHICDECGQGFTEPYYLKVHLRKHTGERPLVCSNCHKSFADPRSYKTHVLTHSQERPYRCKVCAKGFTQNANLMRHIRVHTREKPYICRICDKSFSQSSTLRKHLQIHEK